MLDPPTVDITGRVLEMLGSHGFTQKDRCVQRAMQFIRQEQEQDPPFASHADMEAGDRTGLLAVDGDRLFRLDGAFLRVREVGGELGLYRGPFGTGFELFDARLAAPA